MMNSLIIALCCGLLIGCASTDPYGYAPVALRLQQDDAVGDCARLFQVSDRLIDEAGTRDAQAPRVPGFPYRRVDRVLAQMAVQSDLTAPQAQAWSVALAVLDAAARRIELGNASHDATAFTDALASCRQLLAWVDQNELPALLEAIQVPDDYSIGMRALGLYPLTRYTFAAGILSLPASGAGSATRWQSLPHRPRLTRLPPCVGATPSANLWPPCRHCSICPNLACRCSLDRH